MTEPIPIQPRPAPGWEEEQAATQNCLLHSKPCSDAKVREKWGSPICWDGWVALLHATGTCCGECHYETEPGNYPADLKVRPCRQDQL